MPIDYSKYPKNWKSEIVPDVRVRSDNKCECCGLRNYSVGYRNDFGDFMHLGGTVRHDLAGDGLSYPSLQPLTYREARDWSDGMNDLEEDGKRWIVIVLTVAHLDHDIQNNEMSNLKHLCQQCHLRYDVGHHKQSRQINVKRQYPIEFTPALH